MKLKALVIALAASVMLLGCGTAAAAESQNAATERMTLVYSSGEMLIYQDMVTGVQYLVFDGYKQGGICPLYNANGTLYYAGG